MLRDVRCGTDQGIVTDLAKLHHVIRHQTVSTLDQFQSGLRLTDTALPRDQHALAVDIYKNAVHGDAGRQLYVQPADDLRHEGGSRLLRHEHGDLMLIRDLQEDLVRLQFPAEHHAGDGLIAQKLVIDLALSLFGQPSHIGIFHEPDDLQTGCVKMFKISGHLQGRPVDVGLRHLDLSYVDLRGHVFQFHLLDHAS